MKLKWYEDKLSQAVRTELVRNSPAAGQIVADEMRNLIHVQGPPPSSPWNPPHIDTGDLIASIDYAVVPEQLTVVIGSTLDYAVYLEEGTANMAPRPFLTRALVAAGEDAVRELLDF